MVANRRGDFAEAHRHLTEAFALLEAVGDRHGAGTALDSLANTAVQRGELELALELYTVCQERAVAAGNVFYAAKVYQNFATVYARQERWEASLIAGRECIRRSHALGNDYIIAFALWNLAEPLVFLGQEATAAQLISFTARLWVAQFGPLGTDDLSYQETILARVSQAVGVEQTRVFIRAGEQLYLSQAIALALPPAGAS
jgi:tetratricopeptide (TPR) repeat protein